MLTYVFFFVGAASSRDQLGAVCSFYLPDTGSHKGDHMAKSNIDLLKSTTLPFKGAEIHNSIQQFSGVDYFNIPLPPTP
jgi:hypothetical protein